MHNNWNFLRLLRLVLGAIILVEGIRSGEVFFLIFGAIFTLMPLLNVGCCSAAYCNPRQQRTSAYKDEEIHFEEVK
ncbi:MAG TPA: hypothetical protein PLC76_01410 [Saprospiraceae bacterium]|jgi:hypothetical protein|nr:hypothetical protein [Saprospiraceae bacterium]HQP77314.1 hypothetical protein [Saprospiraceae bacterium]HRP83352.1 hypothetical protein [Saprospiraceae bacterium]